MADTTDDFVMVPEGGPGDAPAVAGVAQDPEAVAAAAAAAAEADDAARLRELKEQEGTLATEIAALQSRVDAVKADAAAKLAAGEEKNRVAGETNRQIANTQRARVEEKEAAVARLKSQIADAKDASAAAKTRLADARGAASAEEAHHQRVLDAIAHERSQHAAAHAEAMRGVREAVAKVLAERAGGLVEREAVLRSLRKEVDERRAAADEAADARAKAQTQQLADLAEEIANLRDELAATVREKVDLLAVRRAVLEDIAEAQRRRDEALTETYDLDMKRIAQDNVECQAYVARVLERHAKGVVGEDQRTAAAAARTARTEIDSLDDICLSLQAKIDRRAADLELGCAGEIHDAAVATATSYDAVAAHATRVAAAEKAMSEALPRLVEQKEKLTATLVDRRAEQEAKEAELAGKRKAQDGGEKPKRAKQSDA